jgi:hypothetical protein
MHGFRVMANLTQEQLQTSYVYKVRGIWQANLLKEKVVRSRSGQTTFPLEATFLE